MDVYFTSGFLNIDWSKILMYAIIGAAVAAAVAIAISTLGIGVPFGKAIVLGALAGAAIAFATPNPAGVPPTADEEEAVREKTEEATKTLRAHTDEALRVLEEEYTAGRVTAEAYSRIKDSITRIRAETEAKIKEIEDTAIVSIRTARNEGRLEGGLVGVSVGGLVGGIVGYGIRRG